MKTKQLQSTARSDRPDAPATINDIKAAIRRTGLIQRDEGVKELIARWNDLDKDMGAKYQDEVEAHIKTLRALRRVKCIKETYQHFQDLLDKKIGPGSPGMVSHRIDCFVQNEIRRLDSSQADDSGIDYKTQYIEARGKLIKAYEDLVEAYDDLREVREEFAAFKRGQASSVAVTSKMLQ